MYTARSGDQYNLVLWIGYELQIIHYSHIDNRIIFTERKLLSWRYRFKLKKK